MTVLWFGYYSTLTKSYYWISKTFLIFNFSRIPSRTSSIFANSPNIFYMPCSSLSYLPFKYSKIGNPLSSCKPKECTRLSTMIISLSPLFFIIRRSLIKKPLCVYIQFFRFSTPWIVLHFSFRYSTMGSA